MIRRLARFIGGAASAAAVGLVALTAALPAGACTSMGIPFAPKVDLSTMPSGVQLLANTVLTASVFVLVIGGIVAIVATVASRRAQNPDGTATGMTHLARISAAAAGIAALPVLIGMALSFGASLTC